MRRMHNSQFRLMVTYFTLAVSIMAVYWAVTNMEAIGNWIGWTLTVLSPFIMGFILSYILSIPTNAMQRLLVKTDMPIVIRWKKAISVIAVYLIFIFTIYTAMRLLVPPLISAIVDLIASIPMFYQQFMVFIEGINADDQIPFYLSDMDVALYQHFGLDVTNPLTFINQEAIMSYFGTIVGGANALFRGFLAFVSSIYFLFEMERLGKFLKRFMFAFSSARTSEVLLDYGSKINQYFKKYIFCLILDCIFMAVVGTLILTMLGSPHALLLGMLLGVMNLIPYFGSIIATVIAIIVVWFTQGATMGAISGVILFISQQIDANVVQPRLYGTSLKLSPLLVIISVSVGGAVGGVFGGAIGGTVMGMIVAIPCVKILMNILEDIIDHREARAMRYGMITTKEDD